jgi:hypothetical protein
MCLHCGKQTFLMNTSVGLRLVTSSISDGLNTYKLHFATPKTKGANNAFVQMEPYIIHHFIIQSYARASNLVGFNILINILGVFQSISDRTFQKKMFFTKSVGLTSGGENNHWLRCCYLKVK